MSLTTASAAFFPIVRAGIRTVVSGGSKSFEPLKSPIPVTEISSGTRTPALVRACSAPHARTSLPQIIALGRSADATSEIAAAFEAATL